MRSFTNFMPLTGLTNWRDRSPIQHSIKLFLLSSLLHVVAPSGALAQTTITQAELEDLFKPGNVLEVFGGPQSVTVDIGEIGGPNDYDFTGVTFSLEEEFGVSSLSEFPELTALFPSSALALFVPTDPSVQEYEISFLHFGVDTLFLLGNVKVSPDTQWVGVFVPPDYIPLPLAYDSTWTYTGLEIGATIVGGLPVSVDTLSLVVTRTIDSYGTLYLIESEYQSLRMKGVQESYTAEGQLSDSSLNIDFWTGDGLILFLGPEEGQPDTGTIQAEGIAYLVKAPPVAVEDIMSLPRRYSLEQNYPNPFNPITTIEFSIPQSDLVSIKVYDILGKEVSTLASDYLPIGNHTVNWNGNNQSSGIYFIRMESGNFTQTRKMLLLR